MSPVETYIRELLDIRRSGEAVKETSYYGALSRLFNEIGKTLKPRVHCIINIKNRGAGIPDGGLFTADQLQKTSEDIETAQFTQQIPARGVIEVKSTRDDVGRIVNSEQVLRYLNRYGQVLVTNYREFVLVGKSADGKPVKLETYRLAENETSFWNAANIPGKMAEVHGERLMEYLKRVMLHAAPLTTPEDVAWFLASYARDAKSRIEQKELPALDTFRDALEKALGIAFKDEMGDRFFRSTFIQTLFYGIFSAWVLWSKQHSPGERLAQFRWREANWLQHVPMIRVLYEQIATPTKLGPLGLVEVLDWTGAALNRVDREAFFSRFEESNAVQYFYEPFLEAFDPQLRKDLGVWYTPQEIVQYMVARVDTVLREELHVEDGLADPRVYVLDPCCGTGTYLVEVLKRIAVTIQEKSEDALGGYDVKQAAMERVFGFELLPAPFVVAHLQLGLLLQNLGIALSSEKDERVGVYLTNSLTGWKPLNPDKEKVVQMRLDDLPELKKERDTAAYIKRDVPILVVLGNPPYNAFAGVSHSDEQELVEQYKVGLATDWGIKKFNLDDLYVRFFRLAEHRIAEETGKGVICYISNFSYLSDPSFVVMRQRFLSEFGALWFDCLNGDSRETGKLTPDGKPDPSVFSTEHNREGIRLGTAISLMVRKAERQQTPTVRFRQFWGVTKRADLLNSLKFEDFNAQYQQANPDKSNRFSFRPLDIAPPYLEWPKLVDLCGAYPFNGPVERRGSSLIVFEHDKKSLALLQAYLDPAKSDDDIRSLAPNFMKSSGEFKAERTRAMLKGKVQYDPDKITRYPFKPFDIRLAYLDSEIQPLFSRPSPELLALQHVPNNAFFITRDTADKDIEGPPFLFSRLICDYDCISGHARHIPIWVGNARNGKADARQGNFFSKMETTKVTPIANLSPAARTYLASLGITTPDADPDTASLIWMHALAIGYSPTYLTENTDGIRQDWPRIPLPGTNEQLLQSAALGQQVARLLDTEHSIPGVTSGKIRSELRSMAVISRVGGGTLNPGEGDIAITAGWGHGSNGSVTMPGKGKMKERNYTPEELTAISEGAEGFGMTSQQTLQHLGDTTCDIFLNDTAYWRNIPIKAWNYTIGGYQVIKKWLSYRERNVLGRSLTREEAREVTNIARRIAAILLLEPALDANYQLCKNSAYPWPITERHHTV